MIDLANESAVWLGPSLLQVASAGTAGRLGVTLVGCWNHLTFHSLSGIWCYQSAGGPAGFSARALSCGLSMGCLTFFTAWWLGSKSKCLRRVRWGCVPFRIQPRKSQNITSALVTSPSRLEGKMDPTPGGGKCQHYHVRRTCGKGCVTSRSFLENTICLKG